MHRLVLIRATGCFLAIFCSAISGAAQYEYSVSGKIRTEYASGIGSGRTSPVYDFNVEVKGAKWYIKLVPDGTVQPTKPAKPKDEYSFPDYLEASSDGGSYFFVSDTSSQKAKHPKVGNRGEASRGIGSVPFAGCPSEMLVLWYAYASHQYLSAAKGTNIYPLRRIVPHLEPAPYVRPAQWILSQEPPFLPVSIAVLEKTSWGGTNEIVTLEYTNTLFSVRAFTNVLSIALPCDVEVAYYYCWPTSKPSPPRFHSRTIISASRFSSKVSEDVAFIPKLPPPSVVHDFSRLTGSEPRVVTVMSTQWPSATQIARRYNEVIQIENRHKTTDVKKATVVRCLLIAIIVVPLAVICVNATRKLLKNRKTEKTKNNEKVDHL
jgi:hypothetical protein